MSNVDTPVIPDVVGPVVGWRVWGVESNERLLLLSPQRQTVWPPGEWLHARCKIQESLVRNLQRMEEGPFRPAGYRHYAAVVAAAHDGDTDAPPPASKCRCGIYAVSGQRYGHVHGYNAAIGGIPPHALIYGSVELAGRYCEYTLGWRAEKARVRALCDRTQRPGSAELIARLADRYDIPVIDGPMAHVSDEYFTRRGR